MGKLWLTKESTAVTLITAKGVLTVVAREKVEWHDYFTAVRSRI
jgi:hypothetical protein